MSAPLPAIFAPFSPEKLRERLRVGVLLGKGAYGDVFQATYTVDTARGPVKHVVALKVLAPKFCTEDSKHQQLRLFLREAEVLQRCSHRYIVRCLGLCQLPANFDGVGNSTTTWAMILELLGGGSLEEMLAPPNGKQQQDDDVLPKYSQHDALRWMLCTAEALRYCHEEAGVIHRDVKLANVLLLPGAAPGKGASGSGDGEPGKDSSGRGMPVAPGGGDTAERADSAEVVDPTLSMAKLVDFGLHVKIGNDSREASGRDGHMHEPPTPTTLRRRMNPRNGRGPRRSGAGSDMSDDDRVSDSRICQDLFYNVGDDGVARSTRDAIPLSSFTSVSSWMGGSTIIGGGGGHGAASGARSSALMSPRSNTGVIGGSSRGTSRRPTGLPDNRGQDVSRAPSPPCSFPSSLAPSRAHTPPPAELASGSLLSLGLAPGGHTGQEGKPPPGPSAPGALHHSSSAGLVTRVSGGLSGSQSGCAAPGVQKTHYHGSAPASNTGVAGGGDAAAAAAAAAADAADKQLQIVQHMLSSAAGTCGAPSAPGACAGGCCHLHKPQTPVGGTHSRLSTVTFSTASQELPSAPLVPPLYPERAESRGSYSATLLHSNSGTADAVAELAQVLLSPISADDAKDRGPDRGSGGDGRTSGGVHRKAGRARASALVPMGSAKQEEEGDGDCFKGSPPRLGFASMPAELAAKRNAALHSNPEQEGGLEGAGAPGQAGQAGGVRAGVRQGEATDSEQDAGGRMSRSQSSPALPALASKLAPIRVVARRPGAEHGPGFEVHGAQDVSEAASQPQLPASAMPAVPVPAPMPAALSTAPNAALATRAISSTLQADQLQTVHSDQILVVVPLPQLQPPPPPPQPQPMPGSPRSTLGRSQSALALFNTNAYLSTSGAQTQSSTAAATTANSSFSGARGEGEGPGGSVPQSRLDLVRHTSFNVAPSGGSMSVRRAGNSFDTESHHHHGHHHHHHGHHHHHQDLALVDRVVSVFRLMRNVLTPSFEQEFQEVYSLTGQTGSLLYMAPEVFRHQPYNERVDVFSFGVLLYEVLGRRPVSLLVGRVFKDAREYAFEVSAGYRPVRPRSISPQAWALICSCWQEDPVQRPSMHAVCVELRRLQQALPLHEEEDACAVVAPGGGAQQASSGAAGGADAGGKQRGGDKGCKAAVGCGCVIC